MAILHSLIKYIPKSSFTSKILPFTSNHFKEANFPKNIESMYDYVYREKKVDKNKYFQISKILNDGSHKDDFHEKLTINCLIYKNHDYIILENNSVIFDKNCDIYYNYGLNVVLSDRKTKYNTNYKIHFSNFMYANQLDLYEHYNNRIQKIYDNIHF